MKTATRVLAKDLWLPYETDRLTPREAAHLARRAGFGADWSEIQAAVDLAFFDVVDGLLTAGENAELDQQSQAMKAVIQAGNLPVQLPAWWLYRLQQTASQAREKLVIFWHGHFATSAAKVNSAFPMLAQNETIRQFALEPFEQMVIAISRDPAMLLYLDSATNRRNNPNENYARELMELFCLGIGNYTEHDVRELSRAFTGWEIVRGQFTFNQFQHDPTPKNLLGKAGIESGEEAIAWIVTRPAAARFVAQKLYRFYVSDLAPDPRLLEPLANCLRENQFAIRPVLRMIFTSRLFFSDLAYAKKIRSPVELAIGLLRCIGGSTSPTQLSSSLAELGQSLFYPPNVKGWDGGMRWINSTTMIGRINLVTEILTNAQTNFVGGRNRLDRRFDVSSAADAVQRVEMIWCAQPLEDSHRRKLIDIVERTVTRRDGKLLCAFKALATTAEFQLG